MSPPPCVITPKTSVVVRRGGFLVDGVERPSLSGCKFVGEVRLSVGVGDEPPAPPPSAPAPVAPLLPPAPVAPLAAPAPLAPIAPAPAQVAEVGALPAEVGELLAVYRALEGGGPLLALGAVVAFAAFKASKRAPRRDEAPHNCPLAPRLDELARRVEAVEARPLPQPSAPACSASDLLALVGGAVKGGEAREDKGASA